MAISVMTLLGAEVRARDGAIGKVFDFFFDGETWRLRYLVVDTGTWLPSRKILLSIDSLEHVVPGDTAVHVRHSKELIERSPSIDLAKPVTREEELLVWRHYGAWPHFAPYHVGAGPHKLTALRDKAGDDLEKREHIPVYALHSLAEFDRLKVKFRDDVFEQIADLLVDRESWQIDHFVVHRRLPGAREEHVVPYEHIVEYDSERGVFIADLAHDEAAVLA